MDNELALRATINLLVTQTLAQKLELAKLNKAILRKNAIIKRLKEQGDD